MSELLIFGIMFGSLGICSLLLPIKLYLDGDEAFPFAFCFYGFLGLILCLVSCSLIFIWE